MSIRNVSLLLAAAPLLVGCGESPLDPSSDPLFAHMGGGPVVGSVTGSAHSPCALADFFVPKCDPEAEGELRTFTLNALTHADGSVGGRVGIFNREDGTRIDAAVTCVRYLGDGIAFVTAEVTRVKSGAKSVGEVLGFGVQDNGQGAGAPADRFTLAGTATPGQIAMVCVGSPQTDAFLRFVMAVASSEGVDGNIEVREPASP